MYKCLLLIVIFMAVALIGLEYDRRRRERFEKQTRRKAGKKKK